MLRPEFMRASDTTEGFTLAVSTTTDVPSFESHSWPEKWRTLEDGTSVKQGPGFRHERILVTGRSERPQGTCRSCHSRAQFPQFKSVCELNCAAIPTGLLESELFGHEIDHSTLAKARSESPESPDSAKFPPFHQFGALRVMGLFFYFHMFTKWNTSCIK